MPIIINTTKKKITYAIISIVVLILIVTATVLVLRSINGNNTAQNKTDNTTVDKKTQIETVKSQIATALKDNQIDQAKQLYSQLKDLYLAAGETENAVNTEIDLYSLNHPTVVPEAVKYTEQVTGGIK